MNGCKQGENMCLTIKGWLDMFPKSKQVECFYEKVRNIFCVLVLSLFTSAIIIACLILIYFLGCFCIKFISFSQLFILFAASIACGTAIYIYTEFI